MSTVTDSVRSSPTVVGSPSSAAAGFASVFVIVLPSWPTSTVPSKVSVAEPAFARDGIVHVPAA